MTELNQTPVEPTQARHPWKATLRTVFAAVVSVAAVWGLIIEASGVDSTIPVVAGTVLVAGGITRIMAIPQVNDLLKKIGLDAGV